MRGSRSLPPRVDLGAVSVLDTFFPILNQSSICSRVRSAPNRVVIMTVELCELSQKLYKYLRQYLNSYAKYQSKQSLSSPMCTWDYFAWLHEIN